jgi:hypothetical protein
LLNSSFLVWSARESGLFCLMRESRIAGCGDVIAHVFKNLVIEQRHKWRWARHSPDMAIGAGI